MNHNAGDQNTSYPLAGLVRLRVVGFVVAVGAQVELEGLSSGHQQEHSLTDEAENVCIACVTLTQKLIENVSP